MKSIKLSELNKEKNMIWLDDPTKYEYVRESTFDCHDPRCKPISKQDERETKWQLVGFEKPKRLQKFPDGFIMYRSTYYWLKSYDRGMPEQNMERGYGNFPEIHPSEAVKIVR